MLIGLTGLYCSGKNHIANLLEKRGFCVFDLDCIGHEVLENSKEEIINIWGSGVFNTDGSINRRELGARVFSRHDELARLEAIVHPKVDTELSIKINQCFLKGNNNIVINSALLHKTSFYNSLDCILIVRAFWLTRFIRAYSRDGLNFVTIFKRFYTQKKLFPRYAAQIQFSKKKTDTVIIGNEGLSFFYSFFEHYLEIKLDSILDNLQIQSSRITNG